MSPLKPALPVPVVYLALGGNLGDRRGHLRRAAEALRALPGVEIVATSSLYVTEPVGMAEAPEFLNAVMAVRTGLGPEELLQVCLAIELAAGRLRGGARPPGALGAESEFGPERGSTSSASGGRAPPSSRPLDLDLLIWGDLTRDSPNLTLPHPRLHERAFVLAPLSEIAPDVLVRGQTIAAWAAAAGLAGVVRVPNSQDWARSAPA